METGILYEQKIIEIKNRGKITINDDIKFHRIVDVLNAFFNCDYKAWMRAGKKINNFKWIWFPQLNEIDKEYRPNPTKHGHITAACWSNVLSGDGMTITQKWIATDFLPPWGPFDKIKENKIEDIGVFAKEYKGDYRFVGIFRLDIENSHEHTTVRKQHSNELLFNEW